MKKKYLPIILDITDAKILIIGAGESAYNKAMILKRFDAEVEFVAIDICDKVRHSGLFFKQKAYEATDLDGYLLVYSCTNNEELDRQILADARERRMLCNIHDNPKLCEYISPAVYQYKNMTVSVASNGIDVFKSIKLRNYLREHLEDKIEDILETKD